MRNSDFFFILSGDHDEKAVIAVDCSLHNRKSYVTTARYTLYVYYIRT